MLGNPLSVNTVLAYAPLLSIIAHSLRPGSVCTVHDPPLTQLLLLLRILIGL